MYFSAFKDKVIGYLIAGEVGASADCCDVFDQPSKQVRLQLVVPQR